MNDGITVSRSMTHKGKPVFASKSMLLTFVSQWQILLGKFPSLCSCSANVIFSAWLSISSRRSFTPPNLPALFSFTASCNCCNLNSMLWKSFMVSPNSTGMSANIDWKSPKASPAAYDPSGLTSSRVIVSGMNTMTRQ